MSNWQPGDRALCVREPKLNGSLPRFLARETNMTLPKVGTLYLVHSVGTWHTTRVYLRFPEWVGGWDDCCFRKVVPQCDRQSVKQHNSNIEDKS